MSRRGLVTMLSIAGAVAALVAGAVWWLGSPGLPRTRVGDAEGFVLDPLRGHVVLLTRGAPLVRRDARTLAVVGAPGPSWGGPSDHVVLREEAILVLGEDGGEPLLPGGMRDGVAGPSGSPILRARRRGGEIVEVTADDASFACDVAWPWRSVSLSPDGARLAVTKERSPGGPVDLHLLGLDGRTISTRADVADVAPYWLPAGAGLLFERPGGGLWRHDLAAGESTYVASVRLSRHPSRGAEALAHAPGRILVESVDAEGYLELASIRIGAGAGRESKQLTSGRVAHFGPAVAGGGRFLLFRRTPVEPGRGDESVVLVDRDRELHSWVVARREELAPDPRRGPQVMDEYGFVFVFEDGAVWRLELGAGS